MTTPPLTTRPARAEDAAEVQALDVLTWSTLSSPGSPPDPVGDPFGRRSPGDHLVAGLTPPSPDRSRLVGYVVLGHPTPLVASRHVVEVQGLAVHPAHTGRGIGRALMDATVAEATRRGARKVSLRVLAHNTRARRVYEAAGFTVEGTLVGEFLLDGRPVDDVLMARHL